MLAGIGSEIKRWIISPIKDINRIILNCLKYFIITPPAFFVEISAKDYPKLFLTGCQMDFMH
jgi:hypothetical protein